MVSVSYEALVNYVGIWAWCALRFRVLSGAASGIMALLLRNARQQNGHGSRGERVDADEYAGNQAVDGATGATLQPWNGGGRTRRWNVL